MLQREQTSNSLRFRYVVWNYTSESARPIVYGVGDFHDSDLGDGRTQCGLDVLVHAESRAVSGRLGALGGSFSAWGFWTGNMRI